MSTRPKSLAPPYTSGFNPRSRLLEVLDAGLNYHTPKQAATELTSIPNPWLVEYRNRLMDAQDKGQRDQRLIIEELELYKKQLNDLRDALEALSDEKVANRQQAIDRLAAELEDERTRTAALLSQLSDANRNTTDAQREAESAKASADQYRSELQEKQKALDDAARSQNDLLEQVTELSREVEQMEAKLVQLQASKAVDDGQAATLKGEIESELVETRSRLEESKKEVAEQKEVLTAAEQAFEDELQRNQEILFEVKARNAGLAKELELVKGLTDAQKEGVVASFSEGKNVVSGDI
jgi:chromosome segregation ATPase